MASFAYLDHEGPIPFAHRGGAEDFPENTMAAFDGAYRLGYRYVETDVHVTSDGVLLAFHDSKLDRVTDRTGVISELPWAEVSRAKVSGTEPIPLLVDLLGTYPDLRVNIDAKSQVAVQPLIDVLRAANAVDRVCIGSFSDKRLAQVRAALGPTLCTSMGPAEVARMRFASWRFPVGVPDAPCAQVPVRQGPIPVTDQRFVRLAHNHGKAVHVWTIDDAAEMHRLFDLGVNGIMTDKPAVLRDVMVARGNWPSY